MVCSTTHVAWCYKNIFSCSNALRVNIKLLIVIFCCAVMARRSGPPVNRG